MSLPFGKRQSAAAIVFQAMFANQSAQIFLVFGTLVPPQVAPFSYSTILGTFNNFYLFTANNLQLNALNLIYSSLYQQYIQITNSPYVQYVQLIPPTPFPGSSSLDSAIALALAALASMNTIVQQFSATVISGAKNQPDLTKLQTLVYSLLTALAGINAVQKNTAALAFDIAVTPGGDTVAPGSPATFTVNTSSLNGATGPVTLACSQLPAGATASFSLAQVQVGQSSTLTITTSSTTPVGNWLFAVTGQSPVPQSVPVSIPFLQGGGFGSYVQSALATLGIS